MTRHHARTGMVLALAAAQTLIAGGSVAQTTFTPPSVRAVEDADLRRVDGDTIVLPFSESASEIIGRQVRGRWNARVGEVVDVLAREGGEPVALAVDVGGYADAGRPVILPLDQVVGSEVLMVTLSPDQLANLPRHER